MYYRPLHISEIILLLYENIYFTQSIPQFLQEVTYIETGHEYFRTYSTYE